MEGISGIGMAGNKKLVEYMLEGVEAGGRYLGVVHAIKAVYACSAGAPGLHC